jgi:hypothetical protein
VAPPHHEPRRLRHIAADATVSERLLRPEAMEKFLWTTSCPCRRRRRPAHGDRRLVVERYGLAQRYLRSRDHDRKVAKHGSSVELHVGSVLIQGFSQLGRLLTDNDWARTYFGDTSECFASAPGPGPRRPAPT